MSEKDFNQLSLLQKVPQGLQHVFLWGSSGTGKSVLLFQALRIMLAHFKLKKKETDVIVLTYHHHIKDDSELINDFNVKYLPSIFSDGKIQARTFKSFCEGKKIHLYDLVLQIH